MSAYRRLKRIICEHQKKPGESHRVALVICDRTALPTLKADVPMTTKVVRADAVIRKVHPRWARVGALGEGEAT